jgi:hypothetical protein
MSTAMHPSLTNQPTRDETTKHMPTKFENIKNNGTISLLKIYVAARNNNEKNKKTKQEQIKL